MTIRNIVLWSLVIVAVAVTGVAAYSTYDMWHPKLFPQQYAGNENAPPDDAGHGHAEDHIELTQQARKNIDLQLASVQLRKYPRSLRLPGRIVPRPGRTSIRVSTPVTGVVKAIYAFPGESVKPGDKLFTLHIHYHEIQKTQADLYKIAKEVQINDAERERLRKPVQSGAISELKLLELQYEQRKLQASRHALQMSLKLHRFTDRQIKQIEEGEFVDERDIFAPKPAVTDSNAGLGKTESSKDTDTFEVEELNVKLGDQVTAGHTLCELAQHKLLYVEARVFPQDITIVQDAIENSETVVADILGLDGKSTAETNMPLRILYIDQRIDPASQTAGAYLNLDNVVLHSYQRDNRQYLLWKYRPGQRVYVTIPVREYKNVFVLPVEAVAHDGAEAYVFRENGDVMERQPVHVLYQDSQNTVIAHDGSILPDEVIAHNGAAQILRAMKLKAGGGGGGHHHHH